MKHKHTPLRLALVLLLCLCSLNACSLLDEFSPDTILQAPRLTGADGQIQEAFEEAVGTNVVLVNPVGGEYRSAYAYHRRDDIRDPGESFGYREHIEEGRDTYARYYIGDALPEDHLPSLSRIHYTVASERFIILVVQLEPELSFVLVDCH